MAVQVGGYTVTRRTMLGLMGGAAAVPLLASCSSPSGVSSGVSGDVSLRVGWWGDDTRSAATQEALDLFQAANPSVKVSAEFGGFEGYFEKLSTQAAGGKAPDLVQMSVDGYPAFADKGALVDLGALSEAGSLDLSTFDDTVLEQGRRDGKLVTLPMGLTAPIILLDRAKLTELGLEYDPLSGWEGYADLARAVAEGTPDGYFGTADGGGSRGFLETWVRQDGSALYTEDGKLGFTQGQLEEFLAFWQDLRSSGVAVSAAEQAVFQENLDGLPIVRSIAALDTSFVTIFAGLQSMVPAELGLGPMPYLDASNSGQSPTFGVSWSITATSEHQDEAADLLSFLVNDPESIRALGFSRGVTPSSKYNEIASEGMSEDELKSSGVQYIEDLKSFAAPTPPPLPPRSGEVSQALLRRTNEEVAFERKSITEAAKGFFDEANTILGG